MPDQIVNSSKPKRTFWTVAAFYFLIAFEFFYMASPFALYFYSVYGPGLNFISEKPALAWISSVFLPHIVVDTSSTLVNLHNYIGATLFIIGFIGFCISAGQVYYYKLARKGAVTGGIYKFIRHPQYTLLAISGLGLLLLWPRFIVLFPFVAMLFAYYFLAKAEEKECERKFGQSYFEYRNKTRMFLPVHIHLIDKLPKLPESGLKRYIAILTLYLLAVTIAIGLAVGLKSWSINSFHMLADKNNVYLSVGKIEQAQLGQIAAILKASPEVQTYLGNSVEKSDTKFINYVLPNEWYVSEIGMNRIEGGGGHHFPRNYDKNRYKIVLTKAELRNHPDSQGKAILSNVFKRTTVLEALVDLSKGHVVGITEPPESVPYEGIPRPAF